MKFNIVCSREWSVGAISEDITFGCRITILQDVTSALVDRHIQCQENLESYTLFQAYDLPQCDAMYTGNQHIHHCKYVKYPAVKFEHISNKSYWTL